MLTGLFCFLPLLALVQGLFVSPYVKNIPQSELRRYIAQSDFLSAVITYSDSTKLCEEMEPHLTKVAETYAHFMKTYAVECSTMEEPKCTPEMAAKLPGLQLSDHIHQLSLRLAGCPCAGIKDQLGLHAAQIRGTRFLVMDFFHTVPSFGSEFIGRPRHSCERAEQFVYWFWPAAACCRCLFW